jgi:hypothetical protein
VSSKYMRRQPVGGRAGGAPQPAWRGPHPSAFSSSITPCAAARRWLLRRKSDNGMDTGKVPQQSDKKTEISCGVICRAEERRSRTGGIPPPHKWQLGRRVVCSPALSSWAKSAVGRWAGATRFKSFYLSFWWHNPTEYAFPKSAPSAL